MHSDLLKLENQLCFTLYSASRKITSLYQPYLKELSLTYTQYLTMLVLWEKKQLSVKDLGTLLFLDSGTLTPLLKKLVIMDLIHKKRDPSDERSVLITLTPAGEALYEKALEIPTKILCASNITPIEALHLKNEITTMIQKI